MTLAFQSLDLGYMIIPKICFPDSASADPAMDVETMSAQQSDSQSDTASSVLHGETLKATCSATLQQEMPGEIACNNFAVVTTAAYLTYTVPYLKERNRILTFEMTLWRPIFYSVLWFVFYFR